MSLAVREPELAAQPRWIMDGGYADTLEIRLSRANTVFMLDLPRWYLVWRVMRRTILSYGRVRDDIADGCPERFDWEFTKHVWRYNRGHRPKLLQKLRMFEGKFKVLSGRPAIDQYLNEIAAQQQ